MSDNRQYSVSKSPSPYKVTQAPGFEYDNSPRLKQAFLYQRGGEEAANNAKQQLIGNLDSLSSDFVTLFTIMSTIKGKLEETKRLPFISQEHLMKIKKLNIIIEKINKAIVTQAIPTIDGLGR